MPGRYLIYLLWLSMATVHTTMKEMEMVKMQEMFDNLYKEILEDELLLARITGVLEE